MNHNSIVSIRDFFWPRPIALSKQEHELWATKERIEHRRSEIAEAERQIAHTKAQQVADELRYVELRKKLSSQADRLFEERFPKELRG